MHRVLALSITIALTACASHREGETSSTPSEPKGSGAQPRVAAPAAKSASTPAFMGGLSEAEFKALHVPPAGEDAPAGKVPALKGHDLTVGGAKAYLSLPPNAKAPLPGVVVIHEWWGLNDNIRHWADRLAAEGYAALAVDLYEGTIATTADEATAAIQKVDDAKAIATMQAGHAFLVEDARVRAPRTASIGWCFGGRKSLELALSQPDLDGAVVYYGTPETDVHKLAPMKAELLGVFGLLDKSIPPEKVAAFRDALGQAGKQFEIREYEANHAFANPSNPRYDEVNAGMAWEVTRAFLRRVLTAEPVK